MRNSKAATASRHEGAERRLLEAVLIHKHLARLSPRLIPGSSPRSVLHHSWAVVQFCHQKTQGVTFTWQPGRESKPISAFRKFAQL
jgi:hypothetical protein